MDYKKAFTQLKKVVDSIDGNEFAEARKFAHELQEKAESSIPKDDAFKKVAEKYK